jgi:hypothetical protein
MGTRRNRPRRIGRREAERLLSGGTADAGRPELARVLRAVSGPAHPDELADERAVGLFAGRYALRGTGARIRYRSPRRPAIGLRLAVGFAALLLGGLATGAEAGALPVALQQHAHHLFSSLGVPAPTASEAGRRTPGSGPSPATSGPPYSAALIGWCHAYQDAREDLGAKALAELRAAAGGTERIAAFCTAVLAAAASGQPQPAATGPQPDDHPSRPAKPVRSHGPPSPKSTRR